MALTLFVMFIVPAIVVLTTIGLTAMTRAETKSLNKKTYGELPISEILDGIPTKSRKVSPRQQEQWWINNWLDAWKRQVGTSYIPLKGDADYIEPKKYVGAQLYPTPKMLTHQEVLEGNFSEGFKDFILEQEKSTATNKEFDRVLNVIHTNQHEHELRRKMDPTRRMTDFQWNRLYPTLLAHEERRKKDEYSKLSRRTQVALERLALKRERILETTHDRQL